MSPEPKYLEVERWWEEATRCCVCAEDIEDGDEVVWEPAAFTSIPNAVEPAHPSCAVSNGYRLRYPGEAIG